MSKSRKSVVSRVSIIASLMLLVAAIGTPQLIGDSDKAVVLTDTSVKTYQTISVHDYTMAETKTNSYSAATLITNMVNLNGVHKSDVTVTSAAIDTRVPGTYTINFKQDYHSPKSATLTITNQPVMLSAAEPNVVVEKGSSQLDYITAFNASAYEFSGDSLAITVDDNEVNYNQVGTYPIVFSAIGSDQQLSEDNGTLTRYIEVVDGRPTISASNVTINEESGLDVNALITKSGLVAKYSDGSPIANNAVEFSFSNSTAGDGFDWGVTPGVYTVTATVYNQSQTQSASDSFNLTVNPVAPTISYEFKNRDYPKDAPEPTKAELIALFGINGYEFNGVENGYVISYEYTSAEGYKGDHNGAVPIRFTITDNDGQTDFVEVVLHKKGTITPPPPDPIGPTIELTSKYTSPEGTVLSNDDLIAYFNPIVTDDKTGFTIDVTHNVTDWSKPGNYTVTFKVTDSDGLTATATGQLVITDLKPVITNQINPYHYMLGDPVPTDWKQIFGISATEITDGDLTADVTYVVPDLTTVGHKEITFSVVDEEGNEATKTLAIHVSEMNNNPPTINGKSYYQMPEADKPITKADLIEWFDVSGFDVEGAVNITAEGVTNSNTPGIYEITFTVTDSKGVAASYKGVLDITHVYPKITTDKTAIVVPLNSEPLDIKTAFGVHGSEFTLGDLDSELEISGNVDYTKDGIYKVHIKVVDAEQTIDEKDVYVVVGKPLSDIVLSGSKYLAIPEEINVTKGQLLDRLGVSAVGFNAYDYSLSDLTSHITITGEYDIHTPGEYPLVITINVNGITKSYDFILEVTDTKPVINADNKLLKIKDTDKLKDLLERFGVSATEITDNDLFGRINIDTSAIKFKAGKLVPGAYPVVFTAVDDEGNEVSETTTVEVTSTQTPDEPDEPNKPDKPDDDGGTKPPADDEDKPDDDGGTKPPADDEDKSETDEDKSETDEDKSETDEDKSETDEDKPETDEDKSEVQPVVDDEDDTTPKSTIKIAATGTEVGSLVIMLGLLLIGLFITRQFINRKS